MVPPTLVRLLNLREVARVVAGHCEVAANLCQLAEVDGGDDVRAADEDVASHAANLARSLSGE